MDSLMKQNNLKSKKVFKIAEVVNFELFVKKLLSVISFLLVVSCKDQIIHVNK